MTDELRGLSRSLLAATAPLYHRSGKRRHERSLAVVLTSSRDADEYRPLLERSGARGFIPKSELSGAAVAALTA
jgi:hypothetical protein